MAKRKGKYIKKQFESTGSPSDTSANIYESMVLSDAWISLPAKARVLYLICKSQYYSQKKKPNGNNEQFTMNRSKWLNKYKLYTASNAAGFYRDMSALIEHGFIDCVYCGANSRTESIYQFSDRWLHYGTKEYQVPETVKTAAMMGWKKRKSAKSGSC